MTPLDKNSPTGYDPINEPEGGGYDETDLDEPLVELPRDPITHGQNLVSLVGQPESLYPRYAVKNARGIPASFRLPDGLERTVDRLVQLGREKGLPWESRTDFFRDATAWFAAALLDRFDWDDPMLTSLESARRIEDQTEFLKNLEGRAAKWAKDLTELMFQYVSMGDVVKAREIMKVRISDIARMQDPYVKSKYQQALTNNPRFGEIRKALDAPKEDA
jgi:hypothetical protein